jgi:hypothetical protein
VSYRSDHHPMSTIHEQPYQTRPQPKTHGKKQRIPESPKTHGQQKQICPRQNAPLSAPKSRKNYWFGYQWKLSPILKII